MFQGVSDRLNRQHDAGSAFAGVAKEETQEGREEVQIAKLYVVRHLGGQGCRFGSDGWARIVICHQQGEPENPPQERVSIRCAVIGPHDSSYATPG